ncbi:hypothetical protein ACB092_01G403900 [Castanea dentata]
MKLVSLILLFLAFLLGTTAEQCGTQAGGAVCPNGLCCSQFGWCGNTNDYCGNGCQSQCSSTSPTTPSSGSDVSSLISAPLFDQMLKHRNDQGCNNGFYTYNAFIAAAQSFNGFGTTGDVTTRKRELAAFLAQTSHETTGPIQLTHNYNYGQVGDAIGADLINNPDLVATDPTISFKTAIWFWMTPQASKPSSHNVIIGSWTPSAADTSAGQVPGYGVITNIVNGGKECGQGSNDKVADRIGFYKRYCDILGVSYGDNLDCYNQSPFA